VSTFKDKFRAFSYKSRQISSAASKFVAGIVENATIAIATKVQAMDDALNTILTTQSFLQQLETSDLNSGLFSITKLHSRDVRAKDWMARNLVQQALRLKHAKPAGSSESAWSPLQDSVWNKIIVELLRAGGPGTENSQDLCGESILHDAARARDLTLIKVLVASRPRLHLFFGQKSRFGKTARDIAAEKFPSDAAFHKLLVNT